MRRLIRVFALAAIVAAIPVSSAGAQGRVLPVGLTFSSDAGGVRDRAGVGTGFDFVLPKATGDPYKPSLLEVDRPAGLLRLTTTAGIAYKNVNTLDNALGVFLANSGEAVKLHASLVDIRALDKPGTYQQGGLWLGPSQDTYVKLVVISSRSGQRVQVLYEANGAVVASKYGPAVDLTGHAVDLRLRIVPETGVLTAAYSIDGGAATLLGDLTVGASLLSPDGFSAGISGSNRFSSSPVTFNFAEFGAECATEDCAAVPTPDPELGDGQTPVGEPGEEPSTGPNPPGGSSNKLSATLRAARRIRARALRRGLPVKVQCTLSCRYEVRVKVPSSAARRLGLTRKRIAVTVGRKVASAQGGRTAKTVLRFARRSRQRLRFPGRRVALKLSLHASAGGNGSVDKKRTVLLRP